MKSASEITTTKTPWEYGMNEKRKFVKAGRWHFAIDHITCYGTYAIEGMDKDRHGFVMLAHDEEEFVLSESEYSELATALTSLNLSVPGD